AWVMVRSDSLDKDSITSAMRQGDFYASTGITLRRLEYDEERR
ncbi:MAG TPA: histidinol-phosphatase, partial [Opitutae bacterium]|nr:histidinol-phosphatase [Opitutae bacterium]